MYEINLCKILLHAQVKVPCLGLLLPPVIKGCRMGRSDKVSLWYTLLDRCLKLYTTL